MKNMKPGKHKKWIAYTLYAILLTMGLLYYLFPADVVREYVKAAIEAKEPRIQFSTGKITPSLSLGLTFSDTRISVKGMPGSGAFKMDSLTLRPEIWSLIQGKVKLCWDAAIYKGALKGCMDPVKRAMKGPVNVSMEIKNVNVGSIESLQGLIGRQIRGNLMGAVRYNGPFESPLNGTGDAELRLTAGQIGLSQPILNLQTIDVTDLVAKAALKEGRIEFSQVELKGRSMNAVLTGTVNLQSPLPKSILDLKGTIEPLGDFYKNIAGTPDSMAFFKQRAKEGKLSFVLQGTIEEPKMRLL